jgi:hypothetical protein
MLSSLIKLVSIVCCLIVALSFAAFASDQAGHGSKQDVAKIASEDTNAPAQQAKQADHHGPLRQKLDGADRALTSPFNGVTTSRSGWTQRIVTTLLAFLVFGLGLGFLARLAALRGI